MSLIAFILAWREFYLLRAFVHTFYFYILVCKRISTYSLSMNLLIATLYSLIAPECSCKIVSPSLVVPESSTSDVYSWIHLSIHFPIFIYLLSKSIPLAKRVISEKSNTCWDAIYVTFLQKGSLSGKCIICWYVILTLGRVIYMSHVLGCRGLPGPYRPFAVVVALKPILR